MNIQGPNFAILFTPLPHLSLFGGISLPTHGLFFLLAALVSRRLAKQRLEKSDFRRLDNSIPAMVFGSLLGARLFFLVSRPDFWLNPSRWLQFWDGGMVSYGGLLGALLALGLLWPQSSIRSMFDQIAPCVLIGIGIGRLGCLFSWHGEEGTVSDRFWAFEVDGVARHPVMLYAALLLLLGGIAFWRRSTETGGKVALHAMLYYVVVRALCDQWREYDPGYLLHLSRAVCSSIALISLILLYRLERIPISSVESVAREK